jgi:hypothetical protein
MKPSYAGIRFWKKPAEIRFLLAAMAMIWRSRRAELKDEARV